MESHLPNHLPCLVCHTAEQMVQHPPASPPDFLVNKNKLQRIKETALAVSIDKWSVGHCLRRLKCKISWDMTFHSCDTNFHWDMSEFQFIQTGTEHKMQLCSMSHGKASGTCESVPLLKVQWCCNTCRVPGNHSNCLGKE